MYIVENPLKFGACVLVCVCACLATEETSECHNEWSHLGATDTYSLFPQKQLC